MLQQTWPHALKQHTSTHRVRQVELDQLAREVLEVHLGVADDAQLGGRLALRRGPAAFALARFLLLHLFLLHLHADHFGWRGGVAEVAGGRASERGW